MAENHLDENRLSSRVGLSARTLQRWRWQGKGPPYLKLGGRVVYREKDVVEWEERNRCIPGKESPNSGRASDKESESPQ